MSPGVRFTVHALKLLTVPLVLSQGELSVLHGTRVMALGPSLQFPVWFWFQGGRMGYVPDLGLLALTSLTCDNGVLAPL